MRLRKIYSFGKCYNENLYLSLVLMDESIFYGAANEFKENREWWVIEQSGKIIAYCGSAYKDGICIFVRAWVSSKHRGKGIHSKLITARVNAAIKRKCKYAITYTTHDNSASANNLFKNGFRLYIPEYRYAGAEMLYFRKPLQDGKK